MGRVGLDLDSFLYRGFTIVDGVSSGRVIKDNKFCRVPHPNTESSTLHKVTT